MKKAALALGLLLVFAAPLFAQGPFADVPTDHWAYEAVNQLQQDGILIGYPDGTFGGKRAMTRYEFAVAVARMIPIITGKITTPPSTTIDTSQFATKADIANMATKADLANLATKADVDALRRLVDEFRDELAALGVDVDALKRDVAALNDRVTAIEKELARVKWNGQIDAIGTAARVTTGATGFDRDLRGMSDVKLLRDVSVLDNAELKLTGKLTDYASANLDVIGGNYLSWIGGTVDDYVNFARPASRTTGLNDQAALYFANVDWAFGAGTASFGRFPIQWTPYTLKMIDVDSYSNINYTDSGNYPMDGAKIDFRLGGVKIGAFAAKNNENRLLTNGLTGQPTSGLYFADGATFHDLGNTGAFGLATIDQSAGARVMIGTPFKGNLGLNYIQAASSDTGGYDKGQLWGADLNFELSSFNIGGSWTRTDTTGTAVADIDNDNTALEGKIGLGLGSLGIDAGYKRIEHNFAAPGYWDKVGAWTNPTNVKGPFVRLRYGLTQSVNLVADAAQYKGVQLLGVNAAMNDTRDKLDYAQAGLKWGLSNTNSVNLGVEWLRWNPSEAGIGNTKEIYYTVGWGYQVGPSAGFKLMYQIVDYKPGAVFDPYGTARFKGQIANAQFGVKF